MTQAVGGRRIVHVLEILTLILLVIVFSRVCYAKFSHASAEPLDAGNDPRVAVVDLVSLEQLAKSTGIPHRLTFDRAADGAITGYKIAYKTNYGEPWATIRERTFSRKICVSCSQPWLEFQVDGTLKCPCEILFDEESGRWIITVAEKTGEVRLLRGARRIE